MVPSSSASPLLDLQSSLDKKDNGGGEGTAVLIFAPKPGKGPEVRNPD
jgi:hypothetical protein